MNHSQTPSPAVSAHNLHKSFGATPVVRDVNLRVPRGQILALLGPSGCGKTTTLRLLAGFEQLDTGRIEIDGRLVADDTRSLPPEQRRVGMVFQDYAIFPHLTVAANVQFGLGKGRDARARMEEMLTFVGLDGQGDKMPHALSGGQQQRVALARALAPNPAVLLLDEPFSNLDAALRKQVRVEVKQLLRRSGATAIFVTHDQEEALFLGDAVAVMENGRLVQTGTPEQIFHAPRTRFVAEFMGHTDFVAGEVSARGIETPLGLVRQALDAAPGTAVSIMTRPDDVTITPQKDGNGRIRDRQFTGMAYVYEVALTNGTVLHSLQPHTVHLTPGAPVQVQFNDAHPLTVFRGETAVSSIPTRPSSIVNR